ncbi:MAG: sugar phosphorylase [Desulfobacterales bacterium]|nr:sugar phosphorylase [Desulfobacterales bacterium]
MEQILRNIYGKERGGAALERIEALIEAFKSTKRKPRKSFTQADLVLITYGDSLTRENRAPLKALHEFAGARLRDAFSTIHILPFFPYSSDDGFSVTDFLQVDPRLGSWADVRAIGKDFELMFDLVINHVSAQSRWFEHYLNEKPDFKELAIEVDPSSDLSSAARPRALPLLTDFEKASGQKVSVWTTFSEDQIDLNYNSLDVLEKMVRILLFYIQQGASILRLDAIAYLWKKIGTSCIHLKETHYMVMLFRAILDRVSPDVTILTETNVPHEENISYFGNGRDEAQMVYNFTLPPLLLHAFITGSATHLSRWAKGLKTPGEENLFFNFTASHDGIGVRPLEGILAPGEIDLLVDNVKERGGRVSYKNNPDGSKSPYELNITYVDALSGGPGGRGGGRGGDAHAARFLASQSIQLALPGVPGIYIHSILGSGNWTEGVRQSGVNRRINREKLAVERVESEILEPGGFRSKIFFPYLKMIQIRRRQRAFHPGAGFEVLDLDHRVFALARHGGGQRIYTLVNLSSEPVNAALSGPDIPSEMTDLIREAPFKTDDVRLAPHQFVWLTD